MSNDPDLIVCVNPRTAEVCECGDYEGWEYEVCEGCGLPAPEGEATR